MSATGSGTAVPILEPDVPRTDAPRADAATVSAVSHAAPAAPAVVSLNPTAKRFFVAVLGLTLLPFLWIPLSWAMIGATVTTGGGIPTPDSFDLTSASALATFTALLLWIGSQAHVASSLFFYGDPEARRFMLRERPGRFVVAPIACIVGMPASLMLAASLPRGTIKQNLVFTIIGAYWVWQAHHYTRQNHGVLAFLARAERTRPSEAEMRAIKLSGLGGILGILPLLGGFTTSAYGALGTLMYFAAFGLIAAGWVVWLRGRSEAAPSTLRTVTMAVLLLFYVPILFFDDVFPAVMGFATAHGLQYLLFMGFVSQGAGPRRGVNWWGAALLVASAVGGGLLLRYFAKGADGAFYGVALGLVMAHFVIDAGMWRLREAFPRQYVTARFPFLG